MLKMFKLIFEDIINIFFKYKDVRGNVVEVVFFIVREKELKDKLFLKW